MYLTRMLSEVSVLVIGFVETAKRKGAHNILWLTEPGPNRDTAQISPSGVASRTSRSMQSQKAIDPRGIKPFINSVHHLSVRSLASRNRDPRPGERQGRSLRRLGGDNG